MLAMERAKRSTGSSPDSYSCTKNTSQQPGVIPTSHCFTRTTISSFDQPTSVAGACWHWMMILDALALSRVKPCHDSPYRSLIKALVYGSTAEARQTNDARRKFSGGSEHVSVCNQCSAVDRTRWSSRN